MTVTAAVIGHILNLCPSRVRQLARKSVLHRAGHGLYLLSESVRGYLEFREETRKRRVKAARARAKAKRIMSLDEIDLGELMSGLTEGTQKTR